MDLDQRRQQLQQQRVELAEFGRQLEEMETGQEQAVAAAGRLTDPVARAQAELDIARGREAHAMQKHVNMLSQHVLALHADVLELAARVETLERRVGAGPGAN